MKTRALVLGIALFTTTTHAATFVVDSISDNGSGTFRQAILDANANPGPDTISFNLPVGQVSTIVPDTSLPALTEAVTIDGYTQPGANPNTLGNGNDAVLLIELDGTVAGGNGLNIAESDCVVRGLVINRFIGPGISVNGGAIVNTVIQGNFIGTDPTGLIAMPNGSGIFAGAPDMLIGGTAHAARNVISGNSGFGIGTGGSTTTNVVIQGNFIGTDLHGTNTLGNADIGIFIGTASGNLIGGVAPGAGNVIAGNDGQGVNITTDGNVVQGNFIGTDLTGTLALGNATDGIFIGSGSIGNQVGGAAGNVVAFNFGNGVLVSGSIPSTSNNLISANAIYFNIGLGIDLAGDGVTGNDLADADDGANHLQNFPVVLTAASVGNTIDVTGTLNSAPNTTFRLEFFANPQCDLSGNGQGQIFLGFTDVATDPAGNTPFATTLFSFIPPGFVIAATATDPNNNTSEFSACATITPGGGVNIADIVVTGTAAPNPVIVGDPLNYMLTVTNTGPDVATAVMLTNTLPASVTLVAASSNLGSCSTAGNLVICDLFDLNAGDAAFVSIDVTPNAVGTITNTASAAANEIDPTPSDNTSTQITTVLPIGGCAADLTANMRFRKSAMRSNLRTGVCRQRVTIVNRLDALLTGPLFLVLDNLTPGVATVQGLPRTTCAAPLGSPYLMIELGNNPLPAGKSVSVLVEFVNPQRKCIRYTLRLLTAPGTP